MTFTQTAHGSIINRSYTGGPVAATAAALTSQSTDWINAVTAYGADPTGVADSAGAINTALGAAPQGGVVYLPRGVYKTSAPLVIPNWVSLMGTGCAINDSFLADQVTTIKPSSPFSSPVPLPGGGGNAVGAIVMTGSPLTNGGGQRIQNLNIDCASAPASVDGICAAGWVYGVIIRDVSVQHATGIGLDLINSGGAGSQPDGWRVQSLLCANGSGDGVFMQAADMICDDVHCIANSGAGFTLKNCASSLFNRCRASDNGGSGYNCTNNNSEWFTLNACASDSNSGNGLLIAGSGTQVCNINDFISSGDVTCGVNINGAARAVIISNLTVTSGGTPPTTGLLIQNSPYFVSIVNAFIQGATAITGTADVTRAVTTLVGSTITKLADSA